MCSNWILGCDFLPNRSKIAQPARLKFLDHLKSGLTSQNPNKLEKGNLQKLVLPFLGRDCHLGEAPPKSVVNPGFGTEPPISEQLSNSDRNLRSELLPQESEPPCHEGDESGDVQDSISGRSVPTSVARHGPGFLNLCIRGRKVSNPKAASQPWSSHS